MWYTFKPPVACDQQSCPRLGCIPAAAAACTAAAGDLLRSKGPAPAAPLYVKVKEGSTRHLDTGCVKQRKGQHDTWMQAAVRVSRMRVVVATLERRRTARWSTSTAVRTQNVNTVGSFTCNRWGSMREQDTGTVQVC